MKAFVAFIAFFELDGKAMKLPLTICEVGKVSQLLFSSFISLYSPQAHTGKTLAVTTRNVLRSFGIEDRVSSSHHSRERSVLNPDIYTASRCGP
jgi:hypothetical protein